MTYLEKFRSSKANAALQKVLRVIQFLSPVISLGLFASRIAKIVRLGTQITHSNGAVLGILAAAVAYTLLAMILQFVVKHGGPKIFRWLMMLLDLLFVGAFIAVAVLTRPHGGSSGPCRNQNRYLAAAVRRAGQDCNLPWGVFILSIISTFLHFLTALFHEVKDRRHEHQEKMRNANGGNKNGY
ncbi:hypothetical protein LTR86_003594 [Recurvomyces mirabilis]|nr:hypothetical protein LTR86_003594 [Recurvomyces mirabilis]